MKPPLLARERRYRLPDPTLADPVAYPLAITTVGTCTTSPHPQVFDIDDRTRDPEAASVAQAACDLCPVRGACLEYALANEPFGFWGGLDAFERLALRGSPLADPDERLAAHELKVRLLTGTSAGTIAAEFSVTLRTIERWKRAAGIRIVELHSAPTGPDEPGPAVHLAA